MRSCLLALIVLSLSSPAAYAQSSNAARYLLNQEIAAACGGGGRIAPEGLIEQDLTGDGRADLIIAHEWISCASGGRSLECGMQVCSVKIFVREGDLLSPKAHMLGGGVRVGSGAVPRIHMHGHGGGATSVRWTGSGFSR